MIKQDVYEGPAYYLYIYDKMAEFGYFEIYKYSGSYLTFGCEVKFLFGYNSNIDLTDDRISSNQLHGQNIVKHKYQNWFLSLEEFNESKRKIIIKTIFEARDKVFGEIK